VASHGRASPGAEAEDWRRAIDRACARTSVTRVPPSRKRGSSIRGRGGALLRYGAHPASLDRADMVATSPAPPRAIAI